jgi:hypothetical protein
MASQPHDDASRLASLAKGGELQLEVDVGHHR